MVCVSFVCLFLSCSLLCWIWTKERGFCFVLSAVCFLFFFILHTLWTEWNRMESNSSFFFFSFLIYLSICLSVYLPTYCIASLDIDFFFYICMWVLLIINEWWVCVALCLLGWVLRSFSLIPKWWNLFLSVSVKGCWLSRQFLLFQPRR